MLHDTARCIEATESTLTSTGGTQDSFAKSYSCHLDYRGDTLVYQEAARWTDMRCFLTDGYRLEVASIHEWRHADGRVTRVSDEEKIEIVSRVVRYAAEVQGVIVTFAL